MAKHPCRVRKLRKSARLSQRELAQLIGLHSQGVMSEIEAGSKRPSLIVALASAVVFEEPLASIFPALSAHAERVVLASALRLHKETEAAENRSGAAAYLGTLIARLRHADASV
jgi:DNA-binding XRE family transcriptional regulator